MAYNEPCCVACSVDYVLHLGHMYTEIFEHNRNATRDEAVKHSLMMMGITGVYS